MELRHRSINMATAMARLMGEVNMPDHTAVAEEGYMVPAVFSGHGHGLPLSVRLDCRCVVFRLSEPVRAGWGR